MKARICFRFRSIEFLFRGIKSYFACCHSLPSVIQRLPLWPLPRHKGWSASPYCWSMGQRSNWTGKCLYLFYLNQELYIIRRVWFVLLYSPSSCLVIISLKKRFPLKYHMLLKTGQSSKSLLFWGKMHFVSSFVLYSNKNIIPCSKCRF